VIKNAKHHFNMLSKLFDKLPLSRPDQIMAFLKICLVLIVQDGLLIDFNLNLIPNN